MTHTDANRHAQEVLENILAAMDESAVCARIDERIDLVVGSYHYAGFAAHDHTTINAILAECVKRIYTQGLQTSVSSDMRSDTLDLLERYYRGTYASGYAAAMFDIAESGIDGMHLVIHRLTEIIKSLERQKYFSYVFTQALGSDWDLKCRIAQILLERYSYLMPLSLATCKPSEIVDQVPALIGAYLKSASTLQEITAKTTLNV
jgi:hypothetical protein